MKLTHVLLLAGATAGAYFLGTAQAASTEAPASVEAFLGRYAQVPGPRPEHEYFKQFVGQWSVDSVVTMGPEMEMKMTGVLDAYLGCNGTWLISDFRGEMMGMQYHGHAVQGYDAVQKKYVGTWIDMMRQGLDPMVGEVDEDGVLVSEGLVPNPMMPMAKIKAKSWFKPGEDEFVYVEKLADGKGGWKPWMRIVHTRIHADHEHADGHEHDDQDRLHEHGR